MKHHLEKHRELYLHNAWFTHAVDNILPLILEGLALQAEKMDVEYQKRLQEIMYSTETFIHRD